MRDDIKKLKVCGGNFVSETALDLFSGNITGKKKLASTILYGRNGSGKSTIARAFKAISGVTGLGLSIASLCDEFGNVINLTDNEKKNIYVFDQKFIDDNIKLEEEDGLNTIVMLGSQVEIDKAIKEITSTVSSQKVALDEQKKMLDAYDDINNELSPKYYLDKMKKVLRGKDSWAERDKQINGKNSINTSVNDETYKKFIEFAPSRERDELLIEYHEKYNKLSGLRSGNQLIDRAVPKINNSYDIKNIRDLLVRKIEKPKLNFRDKLLLDILMKRDINFLYDIKKTFSDEGVEYCPFCTKAVSQEEKEEIILGIERVLTDFVKEHQKKLQMCKLRKVDIDLSPYSRLEQEYQQCKGTIDRFNTEVERINAQLDKKIENPYSPIDINIIVFNIYHQNMVNSLTVLEAARVKHNKMVSDLSPIVHDLKIINDEIAYYDIIDLYKRYSTQDNNMSMLENSYSIGHDKYQKDLNELERLKAQKKNVNIAVNVINHALSYIFFSNDRLKIEYTDDKYQLLVNGQHVKPCQISTGETNAIALCYFFSMIGENKSIEQLYKDSYLIVVDDPITSFDSENKVGTLSYLKSQMLRFLQGNKHTKFLIMTHDLMSFSHLEKILKELREKLSWPSLGSSNFSFLSNSYLLENKELKKINSDYEEYSNLFKIVYSFAKATEDNPSLGIGNIMRQLLEAFAIFQFKLSMETLSTEKCVLDKLKEPYKEHFENLMYRLVLNGESHRRYQINYEPTSVFQPLYSFEEKQRTAKEILCFLYLINKEHVIAHLGDSNNGAVTGAIESDLRNWCDEIKEQYMANDK